MQPNRLEISLASRGLNRVAGIDEVGRGALAGPVVACAVCLNPTCIPQGLADSKKLTRAQRQSVLREIRKVAEISLGRAEVEEIDRLNILNATLLAMRRAVTGLAAVPDHALVDGNRIPADLPCPSEAVVQGDNSVAAIAAASIAAKVARDRIMIELSESHPKFGWDRNAGYGTREHVEAMSRHGVTVHHRRSFAPLRRWLEEGLVPCYAGGPGLGQS